MTVATPVELIAPYRAQLDRAALAGRLQAGHRGRAQRIKLRDLAVVCFGQTATHGSAREVALRSVLAELVQQGAAIATEPGPDGGVWWLADETERQAVLSQLALQIKALRARVTQLERARLATWSPAQGTLLPEPGAD